jgi:hypothetical protein
VAPVIDIVERNTVNTFEKCCVRIPEENMTKTRQQIIDELERREKEEVINETRKTCIKSWLSSVKMWSDYRAEDFKFSLADARKGNAITPRNAAGPEVEQARQDTLALIAELEKFLES